MTRYMTRIETLEAEVKRLNDLRGESVLPIDLDDGSRLYASAVSGGADYVDGMPRQVRLVARDAKGNEVERQYVQTTPQLGAVCRIVFLHGKENRTSVVYREATEELARIGLIPT